MRSTIDPPRMPTMTKGTTPVATEIPVWLALPVVSSTNQGMAIRLKVLPNWEIALADRSPMSGRWILSGRAIAQSTPSRMSDHTVSGACTAIGAAGFAGRIVLAAMLGIDSAQERQTGEASLPRPFGCYWFARDQPAGVATISGVASSTVMGVEAMSGVAATPVGDSAGAEKATSCRLSSSDRPMAMTS